MNGPDKKAWQTAMSEEFDSLLQHNVGTLTVPPPSANILGGMWVFAKKRDEFNRVIRFKARWVVFGNHQIKGFDFRDTYASVGKIDSLRLLLALAVSKKLLIRQFNVKTAFLNGDMKDAVYCKQVLGFVDPANIHKVWRLNKSLYGTKQAARRWQQHFEKTASKFGLRSTTSDEAVYVLMDNRGFLVIHLHVDDSLVFCDNITLLTAFETFIHSQYELKWTTDLTLYLGIKLDINSHKNTIKISQPQYVESILDCFAMINCKATESPLSTKTSLLPGTAEDVESAQDLPFQQLVGCLQWLALTTRPDIAYAVSQVSRFNSAWTLEHWMAAKHILRYLKGTPTVGITFDETPLNISVYSDSDFSQCPTTRRSVTGFVVTAAGGLVSWNSKRQTVVALSTTEAEYMAACECAEHLSWVRSFMFDIFFPMEHPTPFFVDNTSAISIATGDGIKARSKHIDRRFHFIRDQLQQGLLEIEYISTSLMKADFLTKSLGPTGMHHALGLNKMFVA